MAAADRVPVELLRVVQRAYEQTPRMASRLGRARRGASWEAGYAADALVTARMGVYRPDPGLFEIALASVQAQTYPHIEIVVVLDGQDPDLARRVAAIGDDRIRCYERPQNGPYPADARHRWMVAGTYPFNEGFGHSLGSWIAPIDQDDEWTVDHVEVLLERVRSQQAEVVYGAMRVDIAGEAETWIGTWPPQRGDFCWQSALYHAGLTDFLYDVNSYLLDEPGDWNLARRMLEAGVRFDYLPHVVGRYRVRGGATPETLKWWNERAAERGKWPRA